MSFDLFAKIADAQANQRSAFLTSKPGLYTLCIERLALEKKRAGNHFIAEFSVISAEPLSATEPPHAPKTKVAWLQNLDKHEAAPGAVKSFVVAFIGEEPATKAELVEAISVLVGAGNPAKGAIIEAQTYDTVTRAGDPFRGVNWQHVAPKK